MSFQAESSTNSSQIILEVLKTLRASEKDSKALKCEIKTLSMEDPEFGNAKYLIAKFFCAAILGTTNKAVYIATSVANVGQGHCWKLDHFWS